MKTTNPKPNGKRALTPKLRFPEFRDGPEWEVKPLGKIFPITSSKRVHESDWTPTGVPFYRAREIVALNKQEPIQPLFISEDLYRAYSKLTGEICAGHLLVTGVGSIGVPYLVRKGDRFYFKDGNIIWLQNDGNELSGEFLHRLYETDYVQKQVKTMADVGTVATYTIDNAKRTVAAFPPDKSEQQRIADCFSSLDNLIAAQARKLDALKAHKKGLMQQLFPREGETTPRLRFPEFKDAPEWEAFTLSEISPAIFDGTHQTPTYTAKGVPFYSVENLISGNANKFISHEDYLEATRKNKPEMGDILLTRIGKIGYSKVVTWEHEFSVYVTLAVIKSSSKFDSHYMHFFIQSDKYQAELNGKSLQNAVPPKINMDSLRSTKVTLPKKNEQTAIVDCLSSLDDIIAAQTQKLDALKTHKKGLMHQLFPSPEDIQ